MVSHVYFRVYNTCLNFYIRWVYNISHLGLILFPWVYYSFGFIISIPWVYYSRRFIMSIMVDHYQSYPTMVNHGSMSHYEKACLTMKINHAYFSLCNMYIGIYQCWVCIISILGLILFPWVHNPLGLLLGWVYNINHG